MLMNMKDLLAVASEHNFAIPAFNVSHYTMFKRIMEATEELNAPVIIEIHPDELKHIGVEMLAAIKERIYKSPVPACIHLDHCEDLDVIIRAIQCGFTSVMFDGASLPLEENIARCKEVCAVAHPANVSVEGELGTIGALDEQAEKGASVIIYTNPEDAKRFVDESGIDTLAIAIGTSHGLYPKGMTPELKLDLLQEIDAKVAAPLVLHGGSGNPDKEIEEACKLGVNKINISSDIKDAYYKKMREVLQDKLLREPNCIEPACLDAMEVVVKHKINLFGATGKAALY